MQVDPEPLYHQRLYEMVVAYLQTRDPEIFPFTKSFDDAKQRAFVRDLREGLSDLTESGSKRGTSASGYITSDKRLRMIVNEWGEARGDWPPGLDPSNPNGIAGVAPINEDAGTDTIR